VNFVSLWRLKRKKNLWQDARGVVNAFVGMLAAGERLLLHKTIMNLAMTRVTFTIAVAFLCSTAAAEEPPGGMPFTTQPMGAAPAWGEGAVQDQPSVLG
jgi:hypothetical protein